MRDYKAFKKHFEEFIKNYKMVLRRIEELDKLLGIIDSVFCQTIFEEQESFLGILSEIYGLSEDEWLDWYVFENGCGENGYEAGFEGQEIKVRTVDDLIKVLQQTNE